ncbi:MAG: hypothetical protein ABS82_01050 [Rhodanobacter sp. SCN 67-45]|nr:MAG: hypothetical protein ABS82_01050 [Rhodanobacter sp. SCN 67-45]
MDLEHATQSTLARVISTFGVPVLLTVIGTLSGIIMTDIRAEVASQGQQLQQLKGDVRELKATLDTGLVWRIGELERRVNRVEQAQKTP